MMTSSNGNIFRVTGPLCGEFTGPGEFPAQRPVTRSFDVFFDLRLNKPLSKQPWGWWFEMPLCSLWRQCNDSVGFNSSDDSSAISWAPCCYNLQQWPRRLSRPIMTMLRSGVIGVPVALVIPIGLTYQHVARKIKQSYKCSIPHK